MGAGVDRCALSAGRKLAKRRTYERHDTRMHGIVHSHGRFQTVVIRDISRGGMKLENAFGLMPGDAVKIELLSSRTLEGIVAWSVAAFCGVAFRTALAEGDPLLKKA